MRSVGRRQYRRRTTRRKKNSFFPRLFAIALLGVIIYLLYSAFSALFNAVSSESITAEFQILEGRAEFSLAESDQWAPAFSDAKFVTGDQIKTLPKSRASLDVLGGNTVFLNENTTIELVQLEQQSSQEKYLVQIKLLSGELWIRVSEDFKTSNDKSQFAIITPQATTNVRGTILDISVQDNQDIIRLIKGSASVSIPLDEQQKNTKEVTLGVNQKLVLTTDRINQIQEGADLVEGLDNSFQESDWHINNLEKFSPQEANDIRRIIELKQPKTDETETATSNIIDTNEESTLPGPEFVFPSQDEVITANPDNIVRIEGIAPENTRQIVINDFALTQFQEGDRKWYYTAADKFGTLTNGTNTVEAYAIYSNGERSKIETLTFIYEGNTPPAETPPAEVSTNTVSQNTGTFDKPVITFPLRPSTDSPYQTSSKIVTIKGTVPPNTQAVEVFYQNEEVSVQNTFRLKAFTPGDSRFSYVANPEYKNINTGLNIYKIKAIGPNNITSETSVEIVYTPISIE